MVDPKKHNAEVDALRLNRVKVEQSYGQCLRAIDKLDPKDRIEVLNRLLLAYGVRREEVTL